MAYPNDMSRTTDMIAGATASDPNFAANSKKAARNIIRRTYFLPKFAADGSAATTTTYTASPMIRMPRAARLLGAAVLPQGAVTADATNYGTINVVKGDGAAGTAVVMAALNTDLTGGSWVAGTTKALTISATDANLRIPAGSVLSFNITKTGTGVVIPICAITVDLEEEDIDGYAV